jgi:hypothetical protein
METTSEETIPTQSPPEDAMNAQLENGQVGNVQPTSTPASTGTSPVVTDYSLNRPTPVVSSIPGVNTQTTPSWPQSQYIPQGIQHPYQVGPQGPPQ